MLHYDYESMYFLKKFAMCEDIAYHYFPVGEYYQ